MLDPNQKREQVKCKSCGAEIRFIVTGFKPDKSKQYHPVNEPAEKRWVQVGGRWVLAHTYLSHYATCPNAKDHRQPRQEQPEQKPDEFDIPF